MKLGARNAELGTEEARAIAAFRVPPSAFRPSAFQIAKMTCDYWGVCNFERELVDHFNNGIIVTLPDTFLAAKVVELEDGRVAWEITHAIGHLRALVDLVDSELLAPFRGIEWIVVHHGRKFRRRKVYRLDRFIEIALRVPLVTCHSSLVTSHE